MSDIGAVQVVLLGFGHQNAGFAFVSAIKIHLQGIICKDIFTQVFLQGYIYTGYLTKYIYTGYLARIYSLRLFYQNCHNT